MQFGIHPIYAPAVLMLAAILSMSVVGRGYCADSVEPKGVNESPPSITLAELEKIAGQSNPTLQQAVAAVDQVRGNMMQAGLYPNPQAGYLRTDSGRDGQSRSSGVFFGQEIVTAGKRQKAQAVHAQEVNKLTWQYEAQVQRVMNDVRIRYYDAVGAEQSAKMATRLVKIAEDGLAMTEKLHLAKQATKADVLQARIQLKTVRLTLRESEIRHRTSWKQRPMSSACQK